MSIEGHTRARLRVRGWRRVLALGTTAGLLCLALAAPVGAVTSEEARLEETRAKIATVRSELEAAQSQQVSDAEAFAQAERQLATVMEALNAAEQAVARQQEAVDRAAEKLAALEETQRRQEHALTARAVMLYKQGTLVPVGSVLTSHSPKEALQRTAMVDAVTRADQRIVEQAVATQTAIDAQREQLKAEHATLERVAEQKRLIAADVEELRDDRALQLVASSGRVKQLQAQETHLEAESRELAALARRAERAAAAASRAQAAAAAAAPVSAAPATGGGWAWPASGPVTSGFGYRWGRMHEGIDIGAPSGAPIYAATAGTVSYAGSMGGYGNIVLIDHGGGITTAYAHQSSIMVGVGASVAKGQQIGTVGSTGQSTGPHLHFEVRVGGSPRDPMGYLG